jgi:hypothetical protein
MSVSSSVLFIDRPRLSRGAIGVGPMTDFVYELRLVGEQPEHRRSGIERGRRRRDPLKD